mmetsp:Transcript_66208/g.129768  ORF Transcript_66208/g.129768 Transcript_66208/m.129768 type:complete len:281 (+) Transcript_66208:445-1287(+)
MRTRGRRGAGEVPSARRPQRVRRPRAHGSGLHHGRASRAGTRQLWVSGQRSARGDALHRVQAGGAGVGSPPAGHQSEYGRFHAKLRWKRERTCDPSQPAADFAAQRCGRHRGGNGDQHSAPQPGGALRRPGRSHRRKARLPHRPRRVDQQVGCARVPVRRVGRRAVQTHPGPRLPHGGDHHGHGIRTQVVCDGSRGGGCSRQDQHRAHRAERQKEGGGGLFGDPILVHLQENGHHRARGAVPVQQSGPLGAHGAAREREAAAGGLRPEGRVRPRRRASGD